jgi:hypothetical protein
MSNGRKINSAWRNDFSKFVFLRHNIEPVAVNVKAARAELGPLVAISHNKRLVTISIELASFDESMTITVSVPGDGEVEDVYDLGLARARDIARHFCESPPEKAHRRH